MSALSAPVRAARSTGVVTRIDEVARDTRVIAFDLDEAQEPPVPGQFYQVDCGGGREHLLPRPIAAFDARSVAGRVTLAFMVVSVGWGTSRLCSLAPGETVRMVGPLGAGFELPGEGRPLLVGGGVGIAPLHYLAVSMDRRGRDYEFLVGVTTAERFPIALSPLQGRVELVTDDGSAGEKGLVCDFVGARLDLGSFSTVCTCGPERMMAVVARESEARGIPCQVSLDSRMACGIGACRGCVKPRARGGNLCVCTEGPVFDSRSVEWSSLEPEARSGRG